MSNAFIIQPVNKRGADVEDHLQGFNNIEYLFTARESRPSIWRAEFEELCMERLWERNYDPQSDVLVIVGSMVPLVKLVARIAAAYNTLRVLCWSANEGNYILQEIGCASTIEGSVP